jgi:hypothetical protein
MDAKQDESANKMEAGLPQCPVCREKRIRPLRLRPQPSEAAISLMPSFDFCNGLLLTLCCGFIFYLIVLVSIKLSRQ